jgi:hypothetical protein
VPKKTCEPIAAGGLDDPAARFRLFTAERLELAQKTSSLEKRRASVFDWHSAGRKVRVARYSDRTVGALQQIFVLKSQVFTERT